MIADQTIEEVKQRASLVEIVSESVKLRRVGSNLVGLCPFHGEKTGSFNVREADNYYHCFGCGAKGNVISYVMQTRGLSFPEAVEDLAARYGITVRYEGVQRQSRPLADTRRLYRINEAAAEFFARGLRFAPAPVKTYLAQRQLQPAAIKAFGIGFAPNAWHALSEHLVREKFSEEQIIEAGLARRNARGELYDVFRGRLMFPIWSDRRLIAAFGGRVVPALFSEQEVRELPKYINSPETAVYQKSKVLYALPQAIPGIRERGLVYLVEGYMDVVGLWQAEVRNAVATCGTALTELHLRRLSRVTRKVVVLFDGDQAGRNAAAKAFRLFLNSQIDAWALFLPPEEDPDSLARTHKTEMSRFLEAQERVSLLDAFIAGLLTEEKVASARELGAAGKAAACAKVWEVLAQVQSRIECEELAKAAAFRLMVDQDSLMRGGEKVQALPETAAAAAAKDEPGSYPPVSELPALDRELLHAVMAGRERFIDQVLCNVQLIEALHPASFAFVRKLAAALTPESIELRKSQVKDLLNQFGRSWRVHWIESDKMRQDKDVKLERLFEQCCRAAARGMLEAQLRELDDQISRCREPQEKAELLQHKFELTRQRQL